MKTLSLYIIQYTILPTNMETNDITELQSTFGIYFKQPIKKHPIMQTLDTTEETTLSRLILRDRINKHITYLPFRNDILGEEVCPLSGMYFNKSVEIASITSCGHCFTATSLFVWFETETVCPVCNETILQEEDE